VVGTHLVIHLFFHLFLCADYSCIYFSIIQSFTHPFTDREVYIAAVVCVAVPVYCVLCNDDRELHNQMDNAALRSHVASHWPRLGRLRWTNETS